MSTAVSTDAAQGAPITTFAHAVRHERVAVDTAEGIVMREPPQPQFTLKGRTARSVLRLMGEWHRQLGFVTGGLRWQPSRLRRMVVETPPEDPSQPPMFWELTE